VHAPADAGFDLAAGGAFQRPNFALARAAAEAFLGELDDAAVTRAAAEVTVPGRFELVARGPLTIVDGAHNPSGVAALVASLPAGAAGSLVAVVSILDDKDAAGMLRALLPACRAVVFTSNRNPRALPPATLESLARQLEFTGDAEVVGDPERALDRARGIAGPTGMVLATGSIYLVAGLAHARRAARAQTP
jgi:dihydrofolate synthase/folylpolyglutamate synthase